MGGGGGCNLLKTNTLHAKKRCKTSIFSSFILPLSIVFSSHLLAQQSLNVNGSVGLYVGNALVVQAMGDVNINATGVMSFQNGGTPDFRLKGNFTNDAAGTYTHGTEKIRFNGSALQNADFGGDDVYGIYTDNANHVQVASNVNLVGDLYFGTGHILSSSGALITLGTAATVTNPSNTAHNNGPIAKNFNSTTDFSFPTGHGTSYNPIRFQPNGTSATTIKVQYHNLTPSDNTALAPGLDAISSEEYWDITREAGTEEGEVTLFWDAQSNLTNYDSTVVAFWDGSLWQSAGKQNLTGNLATGTVKSKNLSLFNKVTLATTDLSVLPVELIEFNVLKNNNQVDIIWATGMEINNDYFIIERSQDGVNFLPLDNIKGAGNSTQTIHYAYVDKNPLPGTSYYRLQQVDYDGTKTYSPIKFVNFEGLEIVNVYPNPSQGQFSVQVHSTLDGVLTLTIYDALGKIVSQENITIKKGYTVLNQYINVATGRYFISAQLNNGQYYDYNYILIGR